MWCVTGVLRARGAGIVGLPNVGKSTLFNALTCSQQAKTGNYPFCTIQANVSKAAVCDGRLRQLAAFAHASKLVDVEVPLIDVAGLIEGAATGAGLGNRFLADIRSCRVLLHTVRCFDGSAADGFDAPAPLHDIRVVLNELVLADLPVMERHVTKLRQTRKGDDAELRFAEHVYAQLEQGTPASHVLQQQQPTTQRNASTSSSSSSSQQQQRQLQKHDEWLQSYELLSAKPMLFVLNVDEASLSGGNAYAAQVEAAYAPEHTVRVSAAIEEQTSQLSSREERVALLREYGVHEPPGEVLLRRVLAMLQLQTFFTVGPLMAHAWPVRVGATAREAAGVIHSDFARHFRRARVMAWEALLRTANLASAEMLMRCVDETYVMCDGDILIVEHDAAARG